MKNCFFIILILCTVSSVFAKEKVVHIDIHQLGRAPHSTKSIGSNDFTNVTDQNLFRYNHNAYTGDTTNLTYGGIDIADGSITPTGAIPSDPFPMAEEYDGNYIYRVLVNASVQQINPDDGSITNLGTISGMAGTPTGLAYDWASSTMYVVLLDGGNAPHLGTLDLTTLVATETGVGSGMIIGMDFADDGFIYAPSIDDDNLYQINPATGACTLIGPVGVDLNYGQDVSYNYESDELYTITCGGLYALGTYDLNTGAFNQVADMGGNQHAVFVNVLPACEPGTPGPATNFVVTADAGGALSADLSWTNPTLDYGGDPLTDLYEIRVYRDGVLVYTDNAPVIGGASTWTDNPTASGEYTYAVIGFNDAGEGIPASFPATWVGEDVPGAVENLYLYELNGDLCLTWENPTTGLHGGAFNNPIIGYHIVRSDGADFEVAGETTTWSETPPDGLFSYSVQPYNIIGDGGIAISNYLWPHWYIVFNVFIQLDNYPGETTWEITEDGYVLFSGGPYTVQDGTIEEVCHLQLGEYTFTIYDAWGDGICCDDGEGYYTLSLDGETFFEGSGEFGDSESTTFFAGLPTYGTLDGTVTDGETSAPILGAEITIGTLSGITDDNGYYVINNIPTGTFTVTCEADGYEPEMETGVVIHAEMVTTVDFVFLCGPGLEPISNLEVSEGPGVDEVTLNWTAPGTPEGYMFELVQHSDTADHAYYQNFDNGYGVVYDLTGYDNVYLSEFDFRHSPWGVFGTWDYTLHIVDWDTYTEVATIEGLQTTGDDQWEEGIDFGNVSASGLVGIFLEPLSNDPVDAYPCIDGDDVLDGMSVTGELPDYSAFEASGVGDFLMDLWILAEGGRELVKAKKFTVTQDTENVRGSVNIVTKVTTEQIINSRELTGYNVYVNGIFDGDTDDTIYVVGGLGTANYELGVTAVYDEGESEMVVVNVYSDVNENEISVITKLEDNFPNPFNPTTEISFSIKEAGNAKIDIFNVKGQKVKTLLDNQLPAGRHAVIWSGQDDSGNDVTSGVYFYKMDAAGYSEIKKMILLK